MQTTAPLTEPDTVACSAMPGQPDLVADLVADRWGWQVLLMLGVRPPAPPVNCPVSVSHRWPRDLDDDT